VNDITEAKRLNRRDICTIYDIPPWLIGSLDYPPHEVIADWKWWWLTWPRRKYLAARGRLRKRAAWLRLDWWEYML